MKNFTKGFTLVELLVVIAIIGILASVILPALSTSRLKGQIAKYKGEMDNVKKAAAIFSSNGSGYTGLFPIIGSPEVIDVENADDSMKNLFASLAEKSSDTFIYGLVSPDGNEYAVYGRMPGTDPATLVATDIWCVDNNGAGGNPTVDATTQFTTAVSACW